MFMSTRQRRHCAGSLRAIAPPKLLTLDKGETARKSVHETKLFSDAPRYGCVIAVVLLFSSFALANRGEPLSI
jgi:hypothetical protein